MNPKRVAMIALVTFGVILLVQKVSALHDLVYGKKGVSAVPPSGTSL